MRKSDNQDFGISRIMLILILIACAFLLTGCPETGMDYIAAEEQYCIGWVLHNVDDSTETTLGYTKDDLAVYNYTFDYPADVPNYYRNIYWWISPVHKFLGGGAAATHNPIAVSSRVYYVMGKNPVPEQYYYDWMFSTSMFINYLEGETEEEQFAYEISNQEHYMSEDPWHGMTPVAGDRRNIYFGTSPYAPTSVRIKEGALMLESSLINSQLNKGGGQSYILKDTEISIGSGNGNFMFSLPKPYYEIYSNGELLDKENMVAGSSDRWNENMLYYPAHKLSGDILVKIFIPVMYPAFGNVSITAEFDKTSSDMRLLPLRSLSISPWFRYNEPLKISARIDGAELIYAYYKTDGRWIPLAVENTAGGIVSTSVTITDENVKEIGLKFEATDADGNVVTYAFEPVSVPAREVSFNLESTSAKPGDWIDISGFCEDSEAEACSGLAFDYYLDNVYAARSATAPKESFSDGGELSFSVKIPENYAKNQTNVSVVFDGTGIYPPKTESILVDVIPPSALINPYDEELNVILFMKIQKQDDIWTDYQSIGKFEITIPPLGYIDISPYWKDVVIEEPGHYRAYAEVWAYGEILTATSEFDVLPVCADSDVTKEYPDGKNIFMKGNTRGLERIVPSARYKNQSQEEQILNKTQADKCLRMGSSWYVRERYCGAEGFIQSEEIYCKNGCEDGACISSKCTDSDVNWEYRDGKNPYLLGTAKTLSEIQDDKCIRMGSKWYVRERYCSTPDTIGSEEIFCEKGCENGACNRPLEKPKTDYNMAFVLLATNSSDFTEEKIDKLNRLKEDFSYYFEEATLGKATMDTSTPVYTLIIPEEMAENFLVESVMKEFYKYYDDNFDFVSIYPIFDATPFPFEFHTGIKQNIEGIGLQIYDQTDNYGSKGKLLGINYFPSNYFDAALVSQINGLLHETGHQWGVYVGDDFRKGFNNPELEIRQQGIHFYRGVQSPYETGTPMNSDYWVSNGDGTYRRENSMDSPQKYHPFQLYFMDLLPESEYDTKFKVYNAGIVGQDFDDQNAVLYKEVSVNDIINVEGERREVS